MAGAVFGRHLVIGAGALVLVAHDDGDGGAEGLVVLQAGEDFSGIGLIARGDDVRLAGATTVELLLDILHTDGDAGRAAVNHHTHATSVRFAEGVDAEGLAEGGGHAESLAFAKHWASGEAFRL